MRRDPVTAYVALGANLGAPDQAVRSALEAIHRLPDTRVTRASGLYRTEPFQAVGPDFINAVAELSTGLNAVELLQHLQKLELAAGRERPWPNAPRTLDLDLLLYGDARMESPWLTIPHPRMQGRAFVLVPLAEIAPHRVTPAELKAVCGQPLARLGPGA